MSRAAVVFPGRGAYGRGSFGSLDAAHPWVHRADELRARSGLRPLSEIDATGRFEPALHLRPSNAWPLIFLCGLLDAERIAEDHEVVAVTASSTGWYTALAASGVLGFDAALGLVQALALAAESPPDGDHAAEEMLYPLTDEAWQPAPDRIDGLQSALDATGAVVTLDLGGFVMVGGTPEAVSAVMAAVPEVTLGGRTYPRRLSTADGWHTPLRRASIEAAVASLPPMNWERPNVTLVDGRGVRFTPWSTDPHALAAASLAQGAETFDLAAGVRVVLREYAPDVVLLAGPGASLGGACAQIVVMEGYRGLRTRAAFEAEQAGAAPVLLAMRRSVA